MSDRSYMYKIPDTNVIGYETDLGNGLYNKNAVDLGIIQQALNTKDANISDAITTELGHKGKLGLANTHVFANRNLGSMPNPEYGVSGDISGDVGKLSAGLSKRELTGLDKSILNKYIDGVVNVGDGYVQGRYNVQGTPYDGNIRTISAEAKYPIGNVDVIGGYNRTKGDYIDDVNKRIGLQYNINNGKYGTVSADVTNSNGNNSYNLVYGLTTDGL